MKMQDPYTPPAIANKAPGCDNIGVRYGISDGDVMVFAIQVVEDSQKHIH